MNDLRQQIRDLLDRQRSDLEATYRDCFSSTEWPKAEDILAIGRASYLRHHAHLKQLPVGRFFLRTLFSVTKEYGGVWKRDPATLTLMLMKQAGASRSAPTINH